MHYIGSAKVTPNSLALRNVELLWLTDFLKSFMQIYLHETWKQHWWLAVTKFTSLVHRCFLFFFPAEKNNNMSSTDEPNTARISQYYTYFSDLLAMLIIATHVEFPLKITNDLLTINEDICEEWFWPAASSVYRYLSLHGHSFALENCTSVRAH